MIQQYTLSSGPCVPQHVQSFTRCENNLGSVSWAKSDGAESYLAIAVGQDGHTHMCPTNTTSCTWDDLHCGERYTIHVVANDYLCSSMPSNSTSIRMGKQALTLCEHVEFLWGDFCRPNMKMNKTKENFKNGIGNFAQS